MTVTYSPGVDHTSIGSVKGRIEQFDPTKRTQSRSFLQKIDVLPTWVRVSFFVGIFSIISVASVHLLAFQYDYCVWKEAWIQNWNSNGWDPVKKVPEYCQMLLANMNWCKAQDWCQPLAQLIEYLH